jgi:hypothetical protein
MEAKVSVNVQALLGFDGACRTSCFLYLPFPYIVFTTGGVHLQSFPFRLHVVGVVCPLVSALAGGVLIVSSVSY